MKQNRVPIISHDPSPIKLKQYSHCLRTQLIRVLCILACLHAMLHAMTQVLYKIKMYIQGINFSKAPKSNDKSD